MQVLPSFNYEDIYPLFHSAKPEKQIVPKIQDATIDERGDITPCNGVAKGGLYTGNSYVRFDEGGGRPPPTLRAGA